MATLHASTVDRVGAILLAAGAASRMGRPKQLLEWQGKTLLERSIGTLLESGFSLLIVVGGAYTGAVELACNDAGPAVHFCHNKGWKGGMGSSIACGLAALQQINPNLDAVMIFLADQPLVSPEHVRAMCAQWAIDKPSYLAAYYAGKPGVPAIFGTALFGELLRLSGEKGAKALFEQYEGTIFPLPEAALDIDTPEDWENLLRQVVP